MRLKPRTVGALGAALVASLLGSMALTSSASGSTTPPWEPDPQTASPFGNVLFYDSAGHIVNGGSDLTHLFDYAAATTGVTSGSDAGSNKATLYFALPDHTKLNGSSQPDPTQWTTSQQSNSTNFPNNSAPAPISGTGATNPGGQPFTHPLVTLSSTDANLSAWLGGVTPDTTAGWANIYQVRVYDSGPFGANSSPNYWATDIQVTGNSWQVLYPAPVLTGTTTELSSTLSSPQVQGTTIPLKATVSATDSSSPAGSVQFKDGTTNIGSPVAVSGGIAQTNWSSSVTGLHSLSAVFTPTDLSTYNGSSGPLDYTINAATPAWKPVLSGTVRVGGTLSCLADFDWATTVTYQWLNNGSPIGGATTSSYQLPDSMYQHAVSCTVTATNGNGGPSTTGTSSAKTVAIGPALAVSTKPTLYNRNSRGAVIHGTYEYVRAGTWSPAATSYTYQWYVGSTAIRGATGSSYKIPAAYVGKYISCAVTAHRAAWTNGSYRTAAVKVAR